MARTGIGAAYVQREMAKGRTMASIQQEAKNAGYEIGAKAQQMFNRGGTYDPTPAPGLSATSDEGRTGIGATYVQRELTRGRTLQDIQNEARSKGYTIGGKAQQIFDNAAARNNDYSDNYGLPPSGRFFDPSNFSGMEDRMDDGGFGDHALGRARAAGYSDAQIRSTLAASGMMIGPKAAKHLGVMPGKTFYTGPDGNRRPLDVWKDPSTGRTKTREFPVSYTGQAGTRKGRPELLPYNAYNSLINKPFDHNYLFTYGGESGGESMGTYGYVGEDKDAYSAYSEPDWNKYVGENGYNNPRPDLTGDLDDRGRARPSANPYASQYKSTFDNAVSTGGGIPREEPVGAMGETAGVPEAAQVTDYRPSAEEPTSVDPAPGDAEDGPVVEQIKTGPAPTSTETGQQLKSNRGYLTSGRIRNYYNSRFGRSA